MASIVSAGTTSSTALNMSADTSGVLQLASNNGSVGLTIDTSQQVGINRTPSAGGGPLQVGFDSSANAGVRIQTTNASTAGEILNFINSSNSTAGKVIYGTSQTSVAYQTTTGGQSTGAVLQNSGIAFPATQVASSDANTLDDYEEGTFTVTDASGAGLTFSANTGYYTKVGRLVTISFDPVWPTTSNTAQASISLPFAAVTSGKGGGGAISYTTVSGGVTAYLGTTSAITFYALGTGAPTTNSQLSGKELGVVFTYHANS